MRHIYLKHALSFVVAIAIAVLCVASSPKQNWTFEALSGTPREYSDRVFEDATQQKERLQETAAAIDAATNDLQERAALLAVGERETLYASRIGEDRCAEGPPDQRCDLGRDGRPKSLGYWQVQRGVCPQAWKMKPSAKRLRVEAQCALRVLRWSRERCGGEWSLAVTKYRGGGCRESDWRIRARSYEAYLYVLAFGWPEPPTNERWELAKTSALPGSVVKWARSLLEGNDVGLFWEHTYPEDTGGRQYGGLTTWHWHDPSKPGGPKGWHKGVTIYVRGEL